MTVAEIRQEVWVAASKDLDRVEAAIKFVGAKRDDVDYWERVLHRVKTHKPKRKAPPKPTLSEDHIQRYRDAKYKHESEQYPHWIKDGHFIEPDIPNTATGNGLQKFITEFLNWSGHNATRINVQGVPMQENGKVTGFRPTTTRSGTADVTATIAGRSVKLEIKAGKDKPSEAQLKEQARERKAGGVYEFIHNVQEFFDWYDRFVIFG